MSTKLGLIWRGIEDVMQATELSVLVYSDYVKGVESSEPDLTQKM